MMLVDESDNESVKQHDNSLSEKFFKEIARMPIGKTLLQH